MHQYQNQPHYQQLHHNQQPNITAQTATQTTPPATATTTIPSLTRRTHNNNSSSNNTITTQRTITQVQQETERSFLLLEAIVYPELTNNNINTETNNDKTLITSLTNLLQETQILIPLERDPVKRELARKKLEVSEARLEELKRHAASRISTVKRRMNEDKSRAALFNTTITNGNNSMNGDGSGGQQNNELNELKKYAQEAESLKQSKRGVDEIMDIGTAVLSSLGAQSDTIRRTTDKIEGVVGSLGMSDSLLRAVRRRQWGDAMIVYGGMFLVTLILGLFYHWVHYW
jgi:hypothetical protein